jgi:hypothetical protein
VNFFRVPILLWSGPYSSLVRRFTFSQTVTHAYLAAIFVYCAIAVEFLSRYAHDRPIHLTQVPGEVTRGVMDRPLKHMLYAMTAMTVFIIIR